MAAYSRRLSSRFRARARGRTREARKFSGFIVCVGDPGERAAREVGRVCVMREMYTYSKLFCDLPRPPRPPLGLVTDAQSLLARPRYDTSKLKIVRVSIHYYIYRHWEIVVLRARALEVRPLATASANADVSSTRRGEMCGHAGERSRGSGDSTSATARAVSAAACALGREGAALRSVARPGREARAVPHEPRAECRGSKIALLVFLYA